MGSPYGFTEGVSLAAHHIRPAPAFVCTFSRALDTPPPPRESNSRPPLPKEGSNFKAIPEISHIREEKRQVTKAKKKGEDEEETHPTPELTYTGNTDASDAGARRKGVSFLLLEMDGRKKREKWMSRKFLVVKRWTSIVWLITCGQEMDEHCMAMAGEWICRDERNWNFVVDKTQMSRMVSFRDGITLSELEQNVMKDLCYGGKVGSVALR
ncbi:unnamed protein product [Brassica napus]|uniref:(rape) hypothetical protein n=1 Tax=Brassica napus TaxID=3708 RepID=A0A816JI47_BRANA|nr:unnamed protein product [Brassica napus]